MVIAPSSDLIRLDDLVAARGLAPDRDHAQGLIAQGRVRIGGQVKTKASELVPADAELSVQPGKDEYVSRAGVKLAHAIRTFRLADKIRGALALDLGSSTGGFVDILLRTGADRVVAVELGTDQLHPSLRGNPRIDLREKTDARSLRVADFLRVPDVITADLSFISLGEMLPTIHGLSSLETAIVVLVKPQFEVRPSRMMRGLVRRDDLPAAMNRVRELVRDAGFRIRGETRSPIVGRAKGNTEALFWLDRVDG